MTRTLVWLISRHWTGKVIKNQTLKLETVIPHGFQSLQVEYRFILQSPLRRR